MYKISNAKKQYGDVEALFQVSADIPSDKFTCIMGPSGAGKSTLLRLLAFLESPDEGNISLNLNGNVFSSEIARKPWPLVTCVFQRQFLWPHLSVKDNILLALINVSEDDARRRLEEVTNLFDMASFLDRFPNQISGGEAQRTALARALVLRPRIVLIDEAHEGLDLQQQLTLNRYLLRLRESGIGVIVVTHALSFAENYADHVVIVDGGTITESGERSILKQPNSIFLQEVQKIK